MRLFRLNKSVIRLQGNPEFLKGITSNTLDKPQNAFLNIHGKIVAVFEQLIADENTAYLCIEKSVVQDTLTHIDRFVKLSGVRVEEMQDWFVYYDLDNAAAVREDELSIAVTHGKLVLSRAAYPSISEEEFTLFRLEHTIPLQGIDYHHDFLLNVSTTDLVSFTKGCYLGQEPVSKVYNRSKPTWKLAVRYADECSAEEQGKMTSRVKDPKTGRDLGFVFIKNE